MLSKKLYLSTTSIKMFLTCKRKFKYKYVDRINPKQKISNKYLSFGNSIHKTLADFNKLKDNKYRTLENIHTLLRKNWIRDGYDSIEEEKKFGQWGLDMLTNYFNNPKDIGKQNLIIEEMIYKDQGKYVLCGKLDKVYKKPNGEIEIVDYKTSKKLIPVDNIQLSIYLILAKSLLGYYPSIVSLYYLSENKKIVKKVDDKYIEESIQNILTLCEEIINENNFKCSPNAYCRINCQYYDICDISKHENLIIVNALKNFKNENQIETVF